MTISEVRILSVPGIPIIVPGDDLAGLIQQAAENVSLAVQDGDIVVVTQKIVSKAEDCLVSLADVTPSPLAEQFARQWDKDARQVEVVLQESRRIVKMDRGVIIAETHHGFICANAGVDRSNMEGDDVVAVLPPDPDASARAIRDRLREQMGVEVAVIISDTFGRPWREGLVNVAIGLAGHAGQRGLHGPIRRAGLRTEGDGPVGSGRIGGRCRIGHEQAGQCAGCRDSRL